MLVINPSLYGKTLVAFACYAANKKGDRSRPFLQPKLLAALLPNMTALRPDLAALLPKDITDPPLLWAAIALTS